MEDLREGGKDDLAAGGGLYVCVCVVGEDGERAVRHEKERAVALLLICTYLPTSVDDPPLLGVPSPSPLADDGKGEAGAGELGGCIWCVCGEREIYE